MILVLEKEFERLEKQRKDILAEVRGLTNVQQTWRPNPDAWCLLEVFVHLMTAEGRTEVVVAGHPAEDEFLFHVARIFGFEKTGVEMQALVIGRDGKGRRNSAAHSSKGSAAGERSSARTTAGKRCCSRRATSPRSTSASSPGTCC